MPVQVAMMDKLNDVRLFLPTKKGLITTKHTNKYTPNETSENNPTINGPVTRIKCL